MKVNTGMYKSPTTGSSYTHTHTRVHGKRYHVPVNCKHVSIIYNAIQNAKQYKCAEQNLRKKITCTCVAKIKKKRRNATIRRSKHMKERWNDRKNICSWYFIVFTTHHLLVKYQHIDILCILLPEKKRDHISRSSSINYEIIDAVVNVFPFCYQESRASATKRKRERKMEKSARETHFEDHCPHANTRVR